MRILFASNNLPFPPVSGGAQRSALLLQSLREFAEVDCVFLPPRHPSTEQLNELRRKCRVKLVVSTNDILSGQPGGKCRRFFPGSLGRDLEAFVNGGRFRWQPFQPGVEKLGYLNDYDLIVARYLQTAATFDLFHRRPLALDVDDYDPDRLRQRLATSPLWRRLTIRRCLRFSEAAHKRLIPQASHCWIANPEDRRHPGLANAPLLPNIPYSFSLPFPLVPRLSNAIHVSSSQLER